VTKVTVQHSNIVQLCIIKTKTMYQYLLKNKLTIIGVVIGSIAGYLYYHFVGCSSGTCSITSKPLNSSLYGGIMGGLILNIFKTETIKNK